MGLIMFGRNRAGDSTNFVCCLVLIALSLSILRSDFYSKTKKYHMTLLPFDDFIIF